MRSVETFSPLQRTVLLQADARWNILSGAVRSGKTHASYYLLPMRVAEFPKGNMMLIGKTERTLRRNVIDPLRDLYGNDMVSGIHGDGLVTIFGRQFYVVGANDERSITKIQGIGLVYAYGDEVTTWPEAFFQMLKSRLDKPGAKFDGTCNPESPKHWLKTFIDEGLQDGNLGNLKHFHFTLDDNPFLDQDFVNALKSEYTGLWYKRYIQGLWVLADGVIFDMFTPDVHVVKTLPAMRHIFIGCDYGTSNATVFEMIGIGDDGAVYLMKEYHHAGGNNLSGSKTDIQYANDFVKWLGDVHPQWIFIDPSAKSFRLQLWQMRDKCPSLKKVAPANNDVLTGIRRVGSLLSSKRLFVHESCKQFIQDASLYSWDAKAAARGEDVPVKTNDHAADAVRYAIAGIYDAGLLKGAA